MQTCSHRAWAGLVSLASCLTLLLRLFAHCVHPNPSFSPLSTQVGQLRGSYVYALEKYSLVRVCSRTKGGAEETRLRGLLERQLDLTKEFYYSYVARYTEGEQRAGRNGVD